MGNDDLTLDQGDVRGTDSNSLLRMYDSARGRLDTASSRLARDKADRTIRRIVKELRRRKVPL
jgi:hypothetical protein